MHVLAFAPGLDCISSGDGLVLSTIPSSSVAIYIIVIFLLGLEDGSLVSREPVLNNVRRD